MPGAAGSTSLTVDTFLRAGMFVVKKAACGGAVAATVVVMSGVATVAVVCPDESTMS